MDLLYFSNNKSSEEFIYLPMTLWLCVVKMVKND